MKEEERMKKRIKKTLSMILSIAMVITIFSGCHGKKVNAAVKRNAQPTKEVMLDRRIIPDGAVL